MADSHGGIPYVGGHQRTSKMMYFQKGIDNIHRVYKGCLSKQMVDRSIPKTF